MAKAYRKMADQLLQQKVQNEFPDWYIGSIKISTGEVFLSNDNAEVSLFYHSDENVFELVDITLIKAGGDILAMVDNNKLTEIYNTMMKGVKI